MLRSVQLFWDKPHVWLLLFISYFINIIVIVVMIIIGLLTAKAGLFFCHPPSSTRLKMNRTFQRVLTNPKKGVYCNNKYIFTSILVDPYNLLANV